MPRATPDGMKVCSKCRENKEVGEFGRGLRNSDGLQPHCRICRKQEAHLHYLKTKSAQNARSMAWVKNNPDRAREKRLKHYERNKERLAKKSRDWREENRDKALEICKRYYLKNKEKCLARSKGWKERNKEQVKTSRLAWGRNNKDKLKAQNTRIREKLTNGVVASILGFRTSQVPSELIELKRLQIQIKREIKQQEQAK